MSQDELRPSPSRKQLIEAMKEVVAGFERIIAILANDGSRDSETLKQMLRETREHLKKIQTESGDACLRSGR